MPDENIHAIRRGIAEDSATGAKSSGGIRAQLSELAPTENGGGSRSGDIPFTYELPPPIPQFTTGRGRGMRDALNALAANPEEDAAMRRSIEELTKICSEEYENEKTRAARDTLLNSWADGVAYLARDDRTFHPDRIWHHDIVNAYACKFLQLYCKITRGKKKRHFVKGQTLRATQNLLAHCIVKFTMHSGTQRRYGSMLLVKHGLYHEMEKTVTNLIIKLGLDRYVDERTYFGRNELRMMIEGALENSNQHGRFAKIETISILLHLFFTAARPSSLGPYTNEYEQRKLYPLVEDLHITRNAKWNWGSRFAMKHSKNHNGTEGMVKEFNFVPVQKWYNVPFDVTTTCIGYLFLRGILNYNTLTELYDDPSAVVKIRPEYLKEPLFIAFDSGGRVQKLNGKMRPKTSMSITHSIIWLCECCGLKHGTAYCFRRDAANDYGQKLSSELTSLILGHSEKKNQVLWKHYSRSTANVPVVGVRLGEIGDQPDEGIARQELYTSAAVLSMVASRSLQTEGNSELPKSSVTSKVNVRTKRLKLNGDEYAEALSHPAVNETRLKVENAWEGIYACFEPKARNYNLRGENQRQRSRLTSIVKNCCMLDGMEEAFERCMADLHRAIDDHTAAKRRYVRKAKDKINTDEGVKERVDGILADTVEARLGAIAELNKPMALIEDAMRLEGRNAATMSIIGHQLEELSSDDDSGSNADSADDEGAHQDSAGFDDNDTDGSGGDNDDDDNDDDNNDDANDDNEDWANPHMQQCMKLVTDLFNEDEEETCDAILKDCDISRFLNLAGRHEGTSNNRARNGHDNQKKDRVLFEPPEGEVEIGDGAFDADETLGEDDMFKDIDVDLVRKQYLEYLVYPELALRETREYWTASKKCQKCQAYTHDEEKQEKQWENYSRLLRHVREQHTLWLDLEVGMLTGTGKMFKCPTHRCSYRASKVADVQKHCLEDCRERDYYLKLKEEHNGLRDEKDEKKREYMSKRRQRQREEKVQHTGAEISDEEYQPETCTIARAPRTKKGAKEVPSSTLAPEALSVFCAEEIIAETKKMGLPELANDDTQVILEFLDSALDAPMHE